MNKHKNEENNHKEKMNIESEDTETSNAIIEDETNADKKADTVNNDELNDKYIRLLAEFENFKKRSVKERLELISIANQDTIIPLLSILDDFDRALSSLNTNNDSKSHQNAGFLLIHQKLRKILEQKGLKEMVINEDKNFNPELHEAIAHIDAPSEDKKNKIIDIVEKGYYLNNKLIRHAKVVVGK
ncbi:MAG: nucleotide exchange factor GrpE [Solitalea-like symbiont of Acarus siro]